jgi:hypothetical protein
MRMHYDECVHKAWLVDLWRRLRRQRCDLVKYDEVAKEVGARPGQVRELEYVPLKLVVGSVGRAKDFTRDFWPRANVDRERWTRVDRALQGNVNLPPVELYRLGDAYFVLDGHHRTSVAHANGYHGIEAYVTVVECRVPLTADDFHSDRWLEKTARRSQEGLMIGWQEIEIAKLQYADRLQEAEMRRLIRAVTAGQPTLTQRAAMRIGDWLIRRGQWLKALYAAPTEGAYIGDLTAGNMTVEEM